jgi:hypothetical protein
MRRRRICLFAVAQSALLWPLHSSAQTGRSPTVTRLVKIFLDREEDLLAALRSRDAARLDALLSERFEMRVGHEPGAPVPRADWIASAMKGEAYEFHIEQMAVQDIAPLAVASFLLRPVKAGKGAPPLFIVDTWEPDGNNWRLRVRYVATVAGPRSGVPGDVAPLKIEKKI